MTTNRSTLTDAFLRQGLSELAAGPDGSELLADVLRTVDATPQVRGLLWRPEAPARGVTVTLALGVLLVALIGAVVVLSGVEPPPVPAPLVPQILVLQDSSTERGDGYAITLSGVTSSGAPAELALDELPDNATHIRWSPDGSRMTYFTEDAPEGQFSLVQTGLFVANGDGTTPTPVDAPRVGIYQANGWWNGAYWSPNGAMFALTWNTNSCTGGPDCLPDSGIDVFDSAGQLVLGFETPAAPGVVPAWSPDSLGIGWMTGSCVDGYCWDDTFHWRAIGGDDSESVVPMAPGSSVVWSTSNRLLVVELATESETVGDTFYMQSSVRRVYSTALDGSDLREVPWEPGDPRIPVWSPEGRWLAAAHGASGTVLIRNAETGEDVVATTAPNLSVAEWSPGGDQLLLFGEPQDINNGYGYFAINTDGTGFHPAGEGEDYAWMPVPDESDPSAAPTTPALTVPGTFFPRFTYLIPPDSGLQLPSSPRRNELHFDVNDPGALHDRGVLVLSILPGLVAHGCDGNRIQVSEASPAELVDDLRDRAGLGLSPPTPTTIDGLPAVVADLAYSNGQCGMSDLHLQEGIGGLVGEGPVLEDGARIFVVDAHGTLVAIEVWTASRDDMDAWLPTALEFVNSIHFTSEEVE